MKSLKQNYLINAKIEKVWDALVDPEIIAKWGGGPAEMNDTEGFKFKLWGGDIFGKNIEVIPEKKLVQEWYAGKWGVPSIVSFNLNEKNNTTILNLVHKNIPDKEFKDIEKGWKEYYILPLKQLVEAKN